MPLLDQFEWGHIGWSEYDELGKKIMSDFFNDTEKNKIHMRHEMLIKFVSTQYILQLVKKYSFRLVKNQIHNMIGKPYYMRILAEKAIESSMINSKTDLECAEMQINFHRDLMASIKRPDQENKDNSLDFEADEENRPKHRLIE